MSINFNKIKEKTSFRRFASEVGVPYTTFFTWLKNKKVPVWRIHQLECAAKRLNIDLSGCHEVSCEDRKG